MEQQPLKKTVAVAEAIQSLSLSPPADLANSDLTENKFQSVETYSVNFSKSQFNPNTFSFRKYRGLCKKVRIFCQIRDNSFKNMIFFQQLCRKLLEMTIDYCLFLRY